MDNFTNNTIIEGKSSKITFHRLSLLFKKELLENKKTLITELIVAWGSCILLGSLLGLFGIGGGYAEVLAFYTLLQYIAFIYASLAFSPMKHKKGRISTLMLPASSEEKFFVRWFLAVPILILFLVAGFYLCDIFRIIVAWLSESLTNDNYYRILDIFSNFKLLLYTSHLLFRGDSLAKTIFYKNVCCYILCRDDPWNCTAISLQILVLRYFLF